LKIWGLPSTGKNSSSSAFADITIFFFTVLGTDSNANEAVTSKNWANEQQTISQSMSLCATRLQQAEASSPPELPAADF
jgi:hypothetical protein